MDDLFQNRYRIQTARAKWHGYDGGIYFVTLCTAGREHYFGEIENGTDVNGNFASSVFGK
ncbi:MAG: hypothetical protein IKT02_00105 [Bacteroidales bacterium]|nr:hypothetical protein [Bacteroidales bacterium]